MPSLAHETPVEDVRNALTILRACAVPYEDVNNVQHYTFFRDDIDAAVDRLKSAVAKLEASR